jgi:hypothetical protein
VLAEADSYFDSSKGEDYAFEGVRGKMRRVTVTHKFGCAQEYHECAPKQGNGLCLNGFVRLKAWHQAEMIWDAVAELGLTHEQ